MIFLDTGFFFALFVEGDDHHEQARELFEPYRGRVLQDLFLTSNHVMSETVTLLKKKGHPDPRVRHNLAVHVGELLLAGSFGRLHRATHDDEQAALEYLSRHEDQGYSFADCLSFVLMDQYGITEAFTVDRHFTHRFVARPGPLPR